MNQILQEPALREHVEVRERLVEDEQTRLPDEHACESEAELVAAGDFRPTLVEMIAQAEAFHEELDLALVVRSGDAVERGFVVEAVAEDAGPAR